MHTTVLVRYAEIGTKGNNRSSFEQKLQDNVVACIKAQGFPAPENERRFGRILIHTSASADLSKVFGIASYSFAQDAGTTLETLYEHATPLLSALSPATTFRVTCQRLDKTFPLNSHTVAREFGAFIVAKTGAKVDLHQFDKEFVVEIVHRKLYLVTETHAGPGGLPAGMEGVVVALIDSERAERAALLLMKRGCTVISLLHENKKLRLLPSYACGLKLTTHTIKRLEDIDAIAEKSHAQALVVGDTLHDLKQYPVSLPIFRPLVGEIS
jgi:thiamine biosynthesis protein ThiI